MSRHARRTDANHAAVREALRARGWLVEDLSHIGHGIPDLFAEKGDRAIWIEVKDGTKVPSARKLTDDEGWFHEILKRAGVQVRVIESVDQVANL